jgi:hypothetical protein
MFIASVYHKAAAAREVTPLQQNDATGNITESAERAIKLINEATDMILEGAQSDQYGLRNNPSSVKFADSRDLTTNIMFGDDSDLGKRLEGTIEEFAAVVKASGNKRITPQLATELLGLNTPEGEGSWSRALFEGNWTSWSLVYLGIIENNIILLRDELVSDAVSMQPGI